jgi:hypothetical protein
MNKGGTVVFYTPEQNEQLIKAIKENQYLTTAALARTFSKKYGKSPKALRQKIRAISIKEGLTVGRKYVESVRELREHNKKSVAKAKTKAKSAAVVQPEVGVELPKGMTFEGTPKKVILYKDHFRVYL